MPPLISTLLDSKIANEFFFSKTSLSRLWLLADYVELPKSPFRVCEGPDCLAGSQVKAVLVSGKICDARGMGVEGGVECLRSPSHYFRHKSPQTQMLPSDNTRDVCKKILKF